MVICSLSGCEQLNSCLDCLAAEYPTVKFCRIDAVETGAAERFSTEVSTLFGRKTEIINVILLRRIVEITTVIVGIL